MGRVGPGPGVVGVGSPFTSGRGREPAWVSPTGVVPLGVTSGPSFPRPFSRGPSSTVVGLGSGREPGTPENPDAGPVSIFTPTPHRHRPYVRHPPVPAPVGTSFPCSVTLSSLVVLPYGHCRTTPPTPTRTPAVVSSPDDKTLYSKESGLWGESSRPQGDSGSLPILPVCDVLRRAPSPVTSVLETEETGWGFGSLQSHGVTRVQAGR